MLDPAIERAAWYTRAFAELSRLRCQAERARVDEILTTNEWTAHTRTSWKKRDGRRVATITLREDSSVYGNGYLPLLVEGYRLLYRRGGR
ncbi:MAG: hypothetical protein CW346_17325 [Bacillaceae bacterium]|nr:hypothetical protein [Bacillaceae bacterium]